MDLRQLTQFLAVIEHGTLRQAAGALNITEPALSKSMRRLEDDLGVRLFDRNPKGMTPTIFGRTLANGAQDVHRSVDHAISELEELQGLSRGTVRLGARPSFTNTVLPAAISRLQRDRPGIHVIHREGTSANMLAELKQGELDFIIITMNDQLEEPTLIQEYVADSPVAVVSRRGHPLAGRRKPKRDQLADYPWVLLPQPDPVRRRIEGYFAEHGLGPLVVAAESDSVVFQMSYLSSSDALGYFPLPLLDSHIARGDLKVLNVEGTAWSRALAIVRRRDTSLSPAVQHVITEIRRICGSL